MKKVKQLVLIIFVSVLSSCTQTDTDIEPLKLKEFDTDMVSFLDFKQQVDIIIGSQKIKSFAGYSDILSIAKSQRNSNMYSEEDLQNAASFLEELNLLEVGISSDVVIENVSNYAFENNLICIETRDFLINEISFENIQNLENEISLFINSNNLTRSEINFLTEIALISGGSSEGRMACRIFGSVVGAVAGGIASAVITPWGGAIAGAFIGMAMEDVCEGIAG